MMKRTLTALALFLGPISAQAGDPCPIGFGVDDFGVPSWLDRDDVLCGLQSSTPWLGFTHQPDSDGIKVSRRFRCDDAHTAQ